MPKRSPRAAIGFAVHTGWAAAVALSGPPAALLLRRRLELADGAHDARFVFHAAAERPNSAELITGRALATAQDRAEAALAELIAELAGFALLVALPPEKTLPPMAAILASHPLLHRAEGALFRSAIAQAAAARGLPVATPASPLPPALGKPGPPWGKDQKDAAALAWAALR